MEKLEIHWISHACFKIKTDSGKVIYLDPYQIPDDEEKADIIVASHGHFDHFDNSAVKAVWKDSTIVIGPASESKKLKKLSGKGLKIGESIDIDDIKITLVPSYTIKKGTHPKGNEWAGIIVEAEGKKVYHAGDTERIPEMKDLKDITVALMPCGGTYTMDFEESSEAVLDFKPEFVVPMHNWSKDLYEYKELMAKKDPNIKVKILEDEFLII